MNIFSKNFCRSFQFCFHLALPVLPYREPELLGSIEDSVKMLKSKSINSVLLVTDKGLRSAGNTAALEGLLEKNGIHCAVYDNTNANPTVNNVEEAVEIASSYDLHDSAKTSYHYMVADSSGKSAILEWVTGTDSTDKTVMWVPNENYSDPDAVYTFSFDN